MILNLTHLNSQSPCEAEFNTITGNKNFYKFDETETSPYNVYYHYNNSYISNKCGQEFGYQIFFYVTNYTTTNKTYNYEIHLSNFLIDPIINSTPGLQNFNLETLTGIFAGSLAPDETGCASIFLSLPSLNYSSASWASQKVVTQVTNLTTNAIDTHIPPTPQQLSQSNVFRKTEYFEDDVLSSNATLPFTELFFKKDLIIDNTASITGNTNELQRVLYFDQNSSVKILGGKQLNLDHVVMSTCADRKWEGIKINGNAILNADHTVGLNAKTFIDIENGFLSIQNSQIKNSNIGIHFKAGNSTLLSDFNNNKFDNLDIGVQLSSVNGVKLNAIDSDKPNVFNNCNKGVYSYFSNDIECMYNKFEKIGSPGQIELSKAGILSVRSNILIFGNKFNESGLGLSSYGDKLYVAQENDFVGNTLGARIEKNIQELFVGGNYFTGTNGIRSIFGRQPNFGSNQINNFGTNNENSYGISADFTTAPLLSGNYIYSSNSRGGAIFNMSNRGFVYDYNNFSLLSQTERQSCLELNGGMGHQVYYSHFDAITSSLVTEAFGLRASAGGTTSVYCNDFFQIEEAIVAENGQMDMELKTNNLFDNRVGVKIDKSVLGIQSHHGNLFTGPFFDKDIRGIGLTDEQINSSQFIVNGNVNALHVPTSVTPAGLKVPDPVGTAPVCNAITYTTSPRTRLLALCDYINSIRNNNTMDAVRKKNLLEFYFRLLSKYFPEVNKPYCVSIFLNAFNNTNIQKINIVSSKIDQLLEPQVISQTLKNNFKAALTAYINAIKSKTNIATARSIYYVAATSLKNGFIDRTSIENQLLMEIEIELANFIPADDFESSWKTVYLAFVKLYKQETLNPSEITSLQYISQLCPVDFGDLVYGARALISDIDKTRYELVECTSSEPRERIEESKLVSKELQVSPNPASQSITLNFAENDGKVSIYNLTNVKMINDLPYSNGDQIDISKFVNGIYFVSLKVGGKIITQKFLKVE